MVNKKMEMSRSKIISILLGLSLVLTCSASALVDNNQDPDANLASGIIDSRIVKENIQNFIGSANETITSHGIKELPTGEVFEITTKNGRFYVNTTTGEIESAIIRNGLSASSIKADDLDHMKDQVMTFVKKHYKNFRSKNMVLTESKIIDHGDAGKEYLFIWNEIIGETYTMSTVQIAVLPNWDNSITYIGIDRPLLIDPTPKVAKEDAQQKALQVFNMNLSAETQSRLVIIPYENNQKLVWRIKTVELDNNNTSHGGTVIVDAVSGNVLSTNPLQ